MPFFKRKPVRSDQRKAQTAVPPQGDEPPPPPVDNLAGDPDAYRFREDLAEGRWHEFDRFFATLTDSDVRHFYVNGLANIDGRPEWIEQWVAARPDSLLPVLFSGWHRSFWAWQARGSGRAHTVKEDTWPIFQSRLVAADRELVRAAALDDRDPLPYVRSIWVAMGLSLGQEEVRRRFAEAERRAHLNIGACYAMIQATARKWGGSHDAMFAFARWVAKEAPEGHSGHKMIALAHVERWLDLPKEEKPAYFQSAEVKGEIRAAADRSIRSPAYVGGIISAADRNAFAFCFTQMKDYDAALEQMRLIGPRITSAPWQYQYGGNAGRAFQRALQAAMQATAGNGGKDDHGRPSL
jgi:hypothetical protein